MYKVDFETLKTDYETGKFILRYSKQITEKTANQIMHEKVKECNGHLEFLGEVVDDYSNELISRQYEVVDYDNGIIYTFTLLY